MSTSAEAETFKPTRARSSKGRKRKGVSRARQAQLSAARLNEVRELLYERGFSRGRVARTKAAEWGVTERAVWNYISRAMERFVPSEEGIESEKERYREMLMTKIEKLEHCAVPGAFAAMARLIEVYGRCSGYLSDRVQVEHSGSVAHVHLDPAALAAHSPEELEALARFVELRDKRLTETPKQLTAHVVEEKK